MGVPKINTNPLRYEYNHRPARKLSWKQFIEEQSEVNKRRRWFIPYQQNGF
ncbi:unnamed protein product [Arabidopsis halleri]